MPSPLRLSQPPRRGLSLVELMVGVAIGLFVTAAAAMLVSSQLSSNRQLLVETQIQQDLRATADLVSRDLRRASYAANAETFVALPDSTSDPLQSWARDIDITTGASGSSEVVYRYARGLDPVFALRVSGDVLQRRVGGGGWQPLTDLNVLKVTNFSVTPAPAGPDIPVACPNLCADGTEACWPRARVRELVVSIAGQSATGSLVSRRIQSTVRVRNDYVSFNTDTPAQVCP
jgi:type II secretory pathway component PulJ